MSVVLGIVTAAAVVILGGLFLSRSGEEVYAIPGWGVTLAVVLIVLGLAGSAVVARARRPGYSAAVLLSVALGVFGLLAILSVGIFVLAVAAGLLAWTLRRPWTGPRRGAATAGAALAGAVLPLLLVLALSDPIVDCGPDGTSAGENIFMGLGNGESESALTDAPDGPETGSARGETYEYTFTCENGRLVEFDFRWR